MKKKTQKITKEISLESKWSEYSYKLGFERGEEFEKNQMRQWINRIKDGDIIETSTGKKYVISKL